MKYLTLFFLTISGVLFSCNITEKSTTPKFDIELPKGYIIESRDQDYNLLAASKYENDEIVGTIEVRFSDDRAFSILSNKTYIDEMLNSNKFEELSGGMFRNFEIQTKEMMFLENIGQCFYCVYSGDYYKNDVRVTNVVIQFIKNDKLFTLIGSSLPENFSNNHKQFLKSFETFKL